MACKPFLWVICVTPIEMEKKEEIVEERKDDKGKSKWQCRNNRNSNTAPSLTCCKYSRPLPPLYHPWWGLPDANASHLISENITETWDFYFSNMTCGYTTYQMTTEKHRTHKCILPTDFGRTGLSKQCRPRSDTKECGVWSGSTLTATDPVVF